MSKGVDTEQLRKARGLRSQSEVAKQVGVTRQQICQYESGASAPSLRVLLRLSNLYGVGVEKLVDKNFSSDCQNSLDKVLSVN